MINKISLKVRQARLEKKLTGEELGKMAGVSKSYIARVESGEDISLAFAFKIEKALGLIDEISKLVILRERVAAGIEDISNSFDDVRAHTSHNNLNINLEALLLSHTCAHCGQKNPLKISVS